MCHVIDDGTKIIYTSTVHQNLTNSSFVLDNKQSLDFDSVYMLTLAVIY